MQKREEKLAYVYFTHRQPSFAKNTNETATRTVELGGGGGGGGGMAALPRPQITGYSDIRVSIRSDWAGYNPNLFRLWNINLNGSDPIH